MKTALFKTILAALSLAFNLPLSTYAQGTAFTYQGRLDNSGNPANGVYDLKFSLFNANADGSTLAKPVTNSAVVVSNGLFTTLVDFGSGVFTGGSNWLEIAVSTNGAAYFTTLVPRQPISPVPNAVFAVSTSNLLDTNFVGNFKGDGNNIQNLNPGNIAPGVAQSLLTFNNPGNIFNGSFFGAFQGDGNNIQNLNPGNIAPGVAQSLLTFNNAGNIFNGSFFGAFQGDGNNIQNLNPGNIAPGVAQSLLTFNNAGNIFNGSFFGAFQGDGSGVENIQADAITGGLTTNIVVSVPTGTAMLCFTNGILRAVR